MNTNKDSTKIQWMPPTTVKTLYQQIKKVQNYAARGRETISDQQLCCWTYNNISSTGLFKKSCETWKSRLLADKTWYVFKEIFTNAKKEHAECTAKEARYTNAMTE